MIVIHEENYFRGNLDSDDGKNTSKDYEIGYHGYGMKNMKRICSKYGGDMNYSIETDIFFLNLYLL